MKRIPVHPNKVALVDADDEELARRYKWYESTGGYAATVRHRKGHGRTSAGRSENIRLTRLIAERMGILSPERPIADHINGNRLDDRRENLRAVTLQENNWNLRAHRTPGIRGIRRTEDGTFSVRVGKNSYGHYPDMRTAMLVYDRVALHIRGEFAVLHLPERISELPDDFPITGYNRVAGAARQSGVTGVTWYSPRQCWRVIVRRRTLGYFKNLEDAIAYKESL